MSFITDRKYRLNLLLLILILILAGTLIGMLIYYNRDRNVHNSANIPANEKIDFLNKSIEKIKELEEVVKKETGNKEYKKNELELLIAKKLVAEEDEDTRIDDIKYCLMINSTFTFILQNSPEINKLFKAMIKLKKEEEKYKELKKQIEPIFIKNACDAIVKTIEFYSDASNYANSFVYLYFYFCNKSYDFGQEIKDNLNKMENIIIKLIDTDEYGKVFKIYMLAENLKKIEQKKGIIYAFEINVQREMGYFFDWFLSHLSHIAKKINKELEKNK